MPRLIDADALRERCEANAEGWFCHREITLAEAMKMLCEMIDEVDTIDAEPVRHGQWIKDDRYDCWYCSECGAVVLHNCFGYCHCGAKMDGGDINEAN